MHGIVVVRSDVTLKHSSCLSNKCLELRNKQGEIFEIWRKISSIYMRAVQKNHHFSCILWKWAIFLIEIKIQQEPWWKFSHRLIIVGTPHRKLSTRSMTFHEECRFPYFKILTGTVRFIQPKTALRANLHIAKWR